MTARPLRRENDCIVGLPSEDALPTKSSDLVLQKSVSGNCVRILRAESSSGKELWRKFARYHQQMRHWHAPQPTRQQLQAFLKLMLQKLEESTLVNAHRHSYDSGEADGG